MGKYDRVTFRGVTVDKMTRAALLEVERQLGYKLTIAQGSYSTAVGASAGTHNGGGVVDLSAYDYAKKVRVLRSVGFAAWYRPELWKNGVRIWGAHIHACLIGNARMSPEAARQVEAYLKGGPGSNGLADGSVDTGPRQYVSVRFVYPPPRPTPLISAVLRAASPADRKVALERLANSPNVKAAAIAEEYLHSIAVSERALKNRKDLHIKLVDMEVL